ncbi:hypothetical protein BCR33DRAFT_764217 [Rhizoclosmatium globosum]|uniref:C2H2-type domain-containing protein n=1 Tax=Rhizoclosmatium globosum TaxID=329046 RepID=A0A1Y2CLV4_9FUNG|nr:hypothetical protein BCR33DRAFT_764217 [Rhizoclosmatium globosum]|eukprot:ORY47854.1 hypothetical protein BCR33DRAFT_764217 [Rhizoclosmatium globosum]
MTTQDLYSPTLTLFDPLSPSLLSRQWQFEAVPHANSDPRSHEVFLGSFLDGMSFAFTSFPASVYPFHDTNQFLSMSLPEWSDSNEAVLLSGCQNCHTIQTPDLPSPKQELNDLTGSFTDTKDWPPMISDSSTATATDSKQNLNETVALTTPSDSTLYIRPTKRTSAPTDKKCHFPGCTRVFTKLANLNAHFATHTGIRDFKCRTCSATFTTKNRLVVHERVHTNEKPYTCGIPGCSYAARQKCALTSHMITHLTAKEKEALKERNQRTVPCDECGRLYKNQESLSQHVWKKHKRSTN